MVVLCRICASLTYGNGE